MSTIASFRAKLSVLKEPLDDPTVTEIAVNRPGEAWIARLGERYMRRVELPDLSLRLLESLAEVTAQSSAQDSAREKPLLSATIPINLADGVPVHERGGYRVMIVRAPVVREGTMALCIRKPAVLDLTLDDYDFSHVNEPFDDGDVSDDQLRQLYTDKQWKAFLRAAVLANKPIMLSAGTFAGKTTLLNTLLKLVPSEMRVVTMEDAYEVKVHQPNTVNLRFSRGNQGVASVTHVELLESMMRLTPDVPVVGELRGDEATTYLDMLNTGHLWSISTIHANDTRSMYDRLAKLAMRGGRSGTKESIIEEARSLIPVVVQAKRASNGARYLSEIHYAGA